MKNKLIITILFLLTFNISKSQNNIQTLKDAGVKIKCGCNLKVNNTFIQRAKEQGQKGILGAYLCAINQNNPDIGVLYNINVYDESDIYKNIPATRIPFLEKTFLDQYAKNLKSAGIHFVYKIYKGISVIEYDFDQMGLPTKAMYFIKNKKSYLLQVGTRKGLIVKYTAFTNALEFL